MGKLVVTEFITLDGVIEDPGGGEPFERGGWAFRFDRGDEGDRFKLDELMASDAQLLGRKTYEAFAKAWPAMEGTGSSSTATSWSREAPGSSSRCSTTSSWTSSG
jgi:hypothetical protein